MLSCVVLAVLIVVRCLKWKGSEFKISFRFEYFYFQYRLIWIQNTVLNRNFANSAAGDLPSMWPTKLELIRYCLGNVFGL